MDCLGSNSQTGISFNRPWDPAASPTSIAACPLWWEHGSATLLLSSGLPSPACQHSAMSGHVRPHLYCLALFMFLFECCVVFFFSLLFFFCVSLFHWQSAEKELNKLGSACVVCDHGITRSPGSSSSAANKGFRGCGAADGSVLLQPQD